MGHTQTTYSDRMSAYSNGQLITSTSHDVDGREARETGGIGFGLAVGQHRGTGRSADDPQAVVLGVGTRTATAGTPVAAQTDGTDNTGTGTLSNVSAGAQARAGTYRLTFTGATEFTLYTPDGIPLATRSSAGTITTTHVTLTFAAGGTAMVATDGFDIPVSVIGGVADFTGITLKDKTRSPLDDDTYKNGAIVSVLIRGDVAVTVGDDVEVGYPVTFDASTGELGSDPENIRIPGARWQTRAAADDIAIVRLAGPPGGVGGI